jgi:dolichol kinase
MEIQAQRSDLQWPRRLFHCASGVVVAYFYFRLFTHSQAVYLLGFLTCLIYIFEQIRVNYPEFSSQFNPFSRYLLRAEEQLKESAQVPYIMGLLLTILSFPKPVAIAAILTLAIADPLSAIVGIRFGKRKITQKKTLEGSLAFFTATVISITWSFTAYGSTFTNTFAMAICVAFLISAFELIPLKIDDNLTIPLLTGAVTWPMAILWNVSTSV